MIKMMRGTLVQRFAVATLILVATLAISPLTQAQSTSPLITGVVTNRTTNQPIVNAQVFFYGSAYGTVFTDSTGTYTFRSSNLNSFGGAIQGNLYVGAAGYFEAPPVPISDLSTQPSLPVVRNVTLLPSGPLVTGVVRNAATGQGIAGATVTFSRNPMSTFLGGGTTVVVYTQADGSYAIDASFFNESGLSGTGFFCPRFCVSMQVNATGYLGSSTSITFSTYPVIRDFSLVLPNQTPLANAGPDQTVECAGPNGTLITLNGTGSSDPDGDALTFVWTGPFPEGGGRVMGTNPNVTLTRGTLTISLTVRDGKGGTNSDSVVVVVRDTTAPTLTFTLSPESINSNNHKLVEVTASIQVSDMCDPNPAVTLLSITSSDPDEGTGDGDTSDDIQGANFGSDDRTFLLRAERSGTRGNRIYTVTYQAKDASGNTRIATRHVTVLHNNSPR